MKIEKFNDISEMKTFIDSEGLESDILEYKGYRTNTDAKNHKDDIIIRYTKFKVRFYSDTGEKI